MAEKINELIRDYQAGKLTRREFVRRTIMLTGSLAAANALLTHFYRSTAAAQVTASDPAVLWHERTHRSYTRIIFLAVSANRLCVLHTP